MVACQCAMSSPVSTPRLRLPLVSMISWVRQNVSIASATKPCAHTLRARSISCSRPPGPAASRSTRV
jgi:hypothetical protein